MIDTADLQSRVTRTTPGTEIPITVMRNRERTTVSVTIEELDLDTEGQPRTASTENQSTGFGMTLADMDGQWAQRLRAPSDVTGAVVTDLEPRGTAARAGLQRGDVIVEVNRVPVDSASDAVRELQLVESDDTAFFLVWRNGTEIFIQATRE